MRTPVALVQFRPSLGALRENVAGLTALVEEALDAGAKIVVTPELATTGYSIREAEVQSALGLQAPFDELAQIRAAAIAYQAYVFIGLAERVPNERPRNSVAVFGPSGLITVQRKRGVSEWHARGDLPVEVIQTGYGDLATIICSDAYLPDLYRVAALKGADIVVAPANWWDGGQVALWETRSRENGVWTLVANRWGAEDDARWGGPCAVTECACGRTCRDGRWVYSYSMDNAPSAVIDPSGRARLFRAMDETVARNRVVLESVEVPRCRIASQRNEHFTVARRWPAAYRELANPYYVASPEQGPGGLPAAAKTRVAVFSPPAHCADECALAALRSALAAPETQPRVLAIAPAFDDLVDLRDPAWFQKPPWTDLQQASAAAGVELAALQAAVRDESPSRPAMVILRQGRQPEIRELVHGPKHGAPFIADLSTVRVGVAAGADVLVPELAVNFAKAGVDLVLVSSDSVGKEYDTVSGPWQPDHVLEAWQTVANLGLSVAAAERSGHGLLIHDGGGWVQGSAVLTPRAPGRVGVLDVTPARRHKLNAYYVFDLATLLGSDVTQGP